jgi:hypothetical protein
LRRDEDNNKSICRLPCWIFSRPVQKILENRILSMHGGAAHTQNANSSGNFEWMLVSLSIGKHDDFLDLWIMSFDQVNRFGHLFQGQVMGN